MTVLVTGGAGFIGSTLVRVLLEREHRVTVLDNLSSGYSASGCADLWPTLVPTAAIVMVPATTIPVNLRDVFVIIDKKWGGGRSFSSRGDVKSRGK